MSSLFVILKLLFLLSLLVHSEGECISNYQEVKQSLLRRRCNVDALVSVFYPISELRPSTVDVFYYHVPRSEDIGSNSSCRTWQQVVEREGLVATQMRWLNSPTLLVADLHVLEHMSFMRLAVVNEGIDRVILDPFCEEITDSERIEILAILTSFVSERKRRVRESGKKIVHETCERFIKCISLCSFAHLQQTHKRIKTTSCIPFTSATVRAIL